MMRILNRTNLYTILHAAYFCLPLVWTTKLFRSSHETHVNFIDETRYTTLYINVFICFISLPWYWYIRSITVSRDFKQTLRRRQCWLTMNNRILHAQQRTFIILRPWRILHAVLIQSTTLLKALSHFHDDVSV